MTLIVPDAADLHRPRRAFARLVIYRAADPDAGPWELLEPAAVPNWLRDPDVLARLVDGEMCHDPARDEHWYRARRLAR